MLIKKYFTSVPDIIYESDGYAGLFRALVQIYTTGITPELRLSDTDLPTVTLCNCIKTILDETADKGIMTPFLNNYHRQLEPNPGFRNPRPKTLDAPVYKMHTTTSAERTAILTGAMVLGKSAKILDANQLQEFRTFLDSHPEYADYRLFLSIFPGAEQPVSPMTDEQVAVLHDYCTAYFTLQSVEAALTGKSSHDKHRILGEAIETFIADKHPLNKLITSMLIQRYQILHSQETAEAYKPLMTSPPASAEEDEPAAKGATAGQLALLSYYIFGELGLDFTNSDKSAWARLIHFVSGLNEDNLRKKLDIDFDNKRVQKDLAIVQAAVQELMPTLAKKIGNDKKG